jgi:hypothetical protein
MSDPNEVVTIYKAKNSAEAFVIRNALQEEGIQCQVAETNDPFAGLQMAEPDVMVHISDADRARAIIEQLER